MALYVIRRQVIRGVHSTRRTSHEYYVGKDRYSNCREDATVFDQEDVHGVLPLERTRNREKFGDACVSTIKVPL